jgi:hypothetical protein
MKPLRKEQFLMKSALAERIANGMKSTTREAFTDVRTASESELLE